MHKKAIVYPLKTPGGSSYNNFEIKHSLRSIERHLKENVPVYVIAGEKPDFLSPEVTFIKEKGYMKAMIKACDIAEEIVWWNDDIYLINDLDWEYLRKWRRAVKQMSLKEQNSRIKSSNVWSRNLGKVIKKLRQEGLPTYSYVSHSPYMYETSKLKKLLETWNFGYKTSMETAYGNVYNPPLRKSGDKIMRYHKKYFWGDVCEGKVMLNHDNQGFTRSLRFWLQTKFPNSSKYELSRCKPVVKAPKNKVMRVKLRPKGG
jgi:hypothetical protein